MKKTLKLAVTVLLTAILLCAISAAALADGYIEGYPGLDDEKLYFGQYFASGEDGERLSAAFYTVLNGLKERDSEIPVSGCTEDELKLIVEAMSHEYVGDCFSGSSYDIVGHTDPSTQEYVVESIILRPLYFVDGGEYDETLVAYMESFLYGAEVTPECVDGQGDDDLSVIEIVKRLHDILAYNIDYESAGYVKIVPGSMWDSPEYVAATAGSAKYRVSYYDQTAYSGLVSCATVCAGYSRALQLLLRECGIASVYVTGEAFNGEEMATHGWLKVLDGDEWFNVDLTWDDQTTEEYPNYISYQYFYVSDATLGVDHFEDELTDRYPRADRDHIIGSVTITGEAVPGGTLTIESYTVSDELSEEEIEGIVCAWTINGEIVSRALEDYANEYVDWVLLTDAADSSFKELHIPEDIPEGSTVRLVVISEEVPGLVATEEFTVSSYDEFAESGEGFLNTFSFGINYSGSKLEIDLRELTTEEWKPMILAAYDERGVFVSFVIADTPEALTLAKRRVAELRFFIAGTDYSPLCGSFSYELKNA